MSFFNFVWKVPPNAIDAAQQSGVDVDRVPAWGEQLAAWRHGFEALLHGRDFLFGDTVGAADVCAYPFLKFASSADPDDDDLLPGQTDVAAPRPVTVRPRPPPTPRGRAC